MKLFLLFSLVFTYAFGAPALNTLREFTQSDGTKFMARAYGDHHQNWIKTVDDEILKYNTQTNNFEYAEIKDNKLQKSGTVYQKNNSKRARSLGKVNKLNIEDVHNLWMEKRRSGKYSKKIH